MSSFWLNSNRSLLCSSSMGCEASRLSFSWRPWNPCRRWSTGPLSTGRQLSSIVRFLAFPLCSNLVLQKTEIASERKTHSYPTLNNNKHGQLRFYYPVEEQNAQKSYSIAMDTSCEGLLAGYSHRIADRDRRAAIIFRFFLYCSTAIAQSFLRTAASSPKAARICLCCSRER